MASDVISSCNVAREDVFTASRSVFVDQLVLVAEISSRCQRTQSPLLSQLTEIIVGTALSSAGCGTNLRRWRREIEYDGEFVWNSKDSLSTVAFWLDCELLPVVSSFYR